MGKASKPLTPVRIPTDTVIQGNYFDDNAVYRSILLNPMLKFDDVLDPVKLKTSLERLLTRHDWRKLGGRIRLNEIGKLEFHVPKQFDELRPGFSYSHENFDIDISEHSIASQIPKATSRPAVLVEAKKFVNLTRRPDAPSKLEDYLYSDEPQLGIHIVSFRDATLVSILWPHICGDASAAKAIFDAWSLVLQGRDDEVPPLHGFDNDPLAQLGSNPREKYSLVAKRLTVFQIIVFWIRHLFETLWWGDEGRVMCVPASFITSQREKALQELASGGHGNEKQFLSEGDVLCAWLAKLSISDLPKSSNRTVLISNALDFRGLLAKDLLPGNGVHLGNAVMIVHAMSTVRDVSRMPISETALAIRRGIEHLGTRDQLEAHQALLRESIDKTKVPVVFGDATMNLIPFTNWSKAKYFETNFSGAVRKVGKPLEERSNGKGIPSYAQNCTLNRGLSKFMWKVTFG
ncbi:hypothetical protein HYFRA_00011071 [Hymenoscyphus fraxineus]|uniref:Uncharacterized protein n=1 Tax=Hymenoscyphus fraxineus TaxID=746836 RepID=A0A9N9L2Q0_9HELO|nr:hypothetical protein HYFRA_00011071 [Hymenoscyphus fraxineus]